jgi:SAM-dependent methyltransferase
MTETHYFTEDALREWTRIGDRHRLRDQYFLRSLEKHFRPGSVLELGAATGHLSAILHARGYDVTASDVSPRFVDAIAGRGVKAALVDATQDITAQTGNTFANILAQNVLPFILRNREQLLTTLRMVHNALEPSGRLICISARAKKDRNPGAYFSPGEQIDIARSSGLFRIVSVIPHQVVPTGLYRPWNAAMLNFLDHALAGIASVRLVWVMEKVDVRSSAAERQIQ